MANKSIRSGRSPMFPSYTELELLQLLLEDEGLYPWSLAEAELEHYFSDLEQNFSWDGWSDDEVAVRSEALFSQLDRLWPSPAANQPVAEGLQEMLGQRFLNRMPQMVLSAIAQQARQVFNSDIPLADQLVECVREILPAWGEEDLQVLARPLAYAMRGTQKDEAIDQALAAVHPGEWEQLSDIDRARLSLVVARYALARLG